jgi:hypothetical protein
MHGCRFPLRAYQRVISIAASAVSADFDGTISRESSEGNYGE